MQVRSGLVEMILKDKGLTEYLTAMFADGCTFNEQIRSTCSRIVYGVADREVGMRELEKEWKYQKNRLGKVGLKSD